MGLGSFKALGGAYAVAVEVAINGRDRTFCCASAGNHGLSVAAGAAASGSKAVVVLANTVPADFEQRIVALGATVHRAGNSYEESMKASVKLCDSEGWTLISDSSWPGYLEIPRLIMEGYSVIAWECAGYFRRRGGWPTHVFLQAGVGGLAAAFASYVRSAWDVQPVIVVVEPDRAACLKASVRAGKPVMVGGEVSNMGRLDCKEPSILAFETLRESADDFITVTDEEAAASTARLAEQGFPTTPSGAAGFAGAQLVRSERALVLLTEGA